MATQPKEPGTYNPWIDQRTGIGDRRKGIAESPLRAVLDEAIPGGASLAYVFGSGLLYLFLSQVVTGMFLALYYVPSADHAHTTVAYLTKEVTSGSFLRSVHAYGSSAIVIVYFCTSVKRFCTERTRDGENCSGSPDACCLL